MNPNYRFNRPVTALLVVLSPFIFLVAGIIQGMAEAVAGFRRQVPEAFRWSILEPLQAAYVALGIRITEYRRRVRTEYKELCFNLRWLREEVYFLLDRIKDRAPVELFWTGIATKASLFSALGLLKVLVGLKYRPY